MLRYKIQESLDDNRFLFFNHIIKDGQRAEDIAYNYYGDERLDWTIYVINNILDPKYDWPLDNNRFENFIISKYGSLRAASSKQSTTNIHHYEWIVQTQSTLFDGTILPKKVIIIDETTYYATPVADRDIIRNYDYESIKNEAKRSIKIINKNHIKAFINETQTILA